MTAQSFNSGLVPVATSYLQLLDVPVTQTSFTTALLQHPNYPTLFCISDTFRRFGISNNAFQLAESDIADFTPPFIAYYKTAAQQKDFILVTKMNGERISLIEAGKKETTIHKQDFLKNWRQIILVAAPTKTSGEQHYAEKLAKEKVAKRKQRNLNTGTAFTLVLIATSFITNTTAINTIPAACIISIKFAGLATTLLLLLYEVDKSNAFVKNICTAGGHTNCDAVLKSNAASILGISWSEAGFFYFASTGIFLLLSGASSTAAATAAMTSIAAAAFIPFSIYYQWKVVKQWCTLCLTVQAILFFEVTWVLATGVFRFPGFADVTQPGIWMYVAVSIMIPVTGWYLLKPILLQAKETLQYKNAYKRIMHNPAIFHSLLKQQATAPEGWQQRGIIIGNPNASTTILKVCNPYCGPCAKAHSILENIIKKNNDVNLRIIFTTSGNEKDPAFKPVNHLLCIDNENDKTKTQDVLHDWYSATHKDYEKFAAKYPITNKLPGQIQKINAMHDWCEKAGITYTPTLFINGKLLPEIFEIDDLDYFF